MEIYSVGGSVRDALLGEPVADHDYVVVGARPEDLLALGYKPVGRDFPVFLHPETHAEYALARTERKHGRGYHGFVFYTGEDVTLEEDLARRDLTINAMAKAPDGRLIDPFRGLADLENKVLRHVGSAFAEDPVRLLRLARFAARFFDFSIAPETLALIRGMVEAGEVDHLVPERVWQEVARGLMETHPDRMFAVLRECGALARLLPEVDALFGVPERPDFHPEGDSGRHTLLVLRAAAGMRLSLAARFAALTHDLGKATTPSEILPSHHEHEARGEAPLLALAQRLKIPADCRELALLTIRLHGRIHGICGDSPLTPSTIVKTLEAADFRRRPERFEEMLLVCEADSRGRLGYDDAPYPQAEMWRTALSACRSVNDAIIAAETAADIPGRIHAARVAAVRAALFPQET
ncbi:MAG: multifunctional CCA addition/repair protein [Betaproteobacteria bacterium]|nr:multifunctional CCA addition/repair protein [Betaproteobacteria bacterium]